MTVDEVLTEIFNQSPLPPELKSSKHRWQHGDLKPNAIKSIIEKYTDYKVILIILPKDIL